MENVVSGRWRLPRTPEGWEPVWAGVVGIVKRSLGRAS
jgi:hypothetical protein